MYMFKCYLIDSYSDLHIYIYVYVGFHCIVFNIISGRVLRWKPQLHCEEFLNKHLLCGMIPDFSFQFHSSVWAICKQNCGEIKSWWYLGVTQLFNHSSHKGSLFKSFIKSNGCTSTCGPEITFLSREMDGTKPLMPPNATTTMTSKHKLQLASTPSVSIFPSLFSWLLATWWFSLASSGSDHQEDHHYHQVLP